MCIRDRGKYAFNFNRLESDLNYIPEAELKSSLGGILNVISSSDSNNLVEYIKTEESGTALWKWCIILVLLFLGLESLLLRFWK